MRAPSSVGTVRGLAGVALPVLVVLAPVLAAIPVMGGDPGEASLGLALVIGPVAAAVAALPGPFRAAAVLLVAVAGGCLAFALASAPALDRWDALAMASLVAGASLVAMGVSRHGHGGHAAP